MTNSEYLDLQLELARRKRERPPCNKCETMSYGQAANFYAFTLAPTQSSPAADGWFNFPDGAGMYRYCDECRKLPQEDYSWIEKISPNKFKQFVEAHQDCVFVLDSLRPLLPEPEDKGGFKYL